jgi:pimeloyl-ACP methyl ester carboxylesterase
MSQTVLFIHGGWVIPSCWDPFVSYFEARGYRCLAPAWPGKDRSVEAIRADPSPLAGLGIGEIVDHYDRIVRALDEPPILIGHSFGGSSSSCSSTAGSGRPASRSTRLRPRASSSSTRRRSCRWAGSYSSRSAGGRSCGGPSPSSATPSSTRCGSARRGTGDLEGPDRARFGPPVLPECVLDVRSREPGAGRLREPRSGAPPADRRGGGPRHDARHRPPDVHAYRASPARTELRTFPGRTHWIIAQDGWEEVAQGCLDWIGSLRVERTTITPVSEVQMP